ncbi:hypothetical protein L873DRAFT_1786090 [Choiromyces venosus 120613-1]|uniref:Uncharacterized protein n=1 Tax=Choiromyces venosus 120613-1 TaxID=1336337 RepID=A0A3N4KGD5_9PEZI|nr:hypothetical protein L873DRAFT_1786090 [Choiromyces venosus 120613-1]
MLELCEEKPEILYDVLGDVITPKKTDILAPLSPQQRTLLQNLAYGTHAHTVHFKDKPVINEPPTHISFANASFDICEQVAPTEYQRGNVFERELDPRRSITIEMGHAGVGDEKVLYRSFEEAEVGPRELWPLADSKDYMLLIVVPCKHVEPRIILASQSGLMLNRVGSQAISLWGDCNPENAEALSAEILFDQMVVPVLFKKASDKSKFDALVQSYPNAVRAREPDGSKENLVFKWILKSYQELTPSSGSPSAASRPSRPDKYWELRILETNADKYLDITRRIVISSCARSEYPKCISHFLPPCEVFVRKLPHSPCEMEIKWTDCTQRLGSAAGKFTYGFTPENPNHRTRFHFLEASGLTSDPLQ